jgi:hypothetical protein
MVTAPGEPDTYLRAFTRLTELAVHGADARALIVKAIDALRRAHAARRQARPRLTCADLGDSLAAQARAEPDLTHWTWARVLGHGSRTARCLPLPGAPPPIGSP